jgi:hypothetical protein
MPLNSISDVFPGASISNFAITIPSGALVSCRNPEANDPNEIMFGMLETMNRAITSGTPVNITSTVFSAILNPTTFRQSYSYNVDLDYSSNILIELLDVKPEPAGPTTTTTTTEEP